MSAVPLEPTGSDNQAVRGGGGADVGDEADVKEYIEKLRTTPVDHVIVDAVSALLGMAQAKLGRRDARLLIDLSTIMLDHARAYLPDDRVHELDRRLGGLRFGQVSAENETGRTGNAEANDLDRVPTPPRTSAGTGG
jgi:hypothetical protein